MGIVRKLDKILLSAVLTFSTLVVAIFCFVFFSPRPPLSIDPATLAGDGSRIDYCQLPILDGSGKMAKDIAKGNTPGCAYDHFPLPILRECTEPLPESAADIRGLWVGINGKIGHVERVEQCGARTVITSSGIIHDSGPNATGGFTSNDTEGNVVFSIGDKDYCPRTSASKIWNSGVLEFRAFGWGPIVVKRYLRDEQLIWEYIDGTTTMQRLCQLPENKKIPTPRGSRYAFFAGD
jgi:hypothetical protein